MLPVKINQKSMKMSKTYTKKFIPSIQTCAFVRDNNYLFKTVIFHSKVGFVCSHHQIVLTISSIHLEKLCFTSPLRGCQSAMPKWRMFSQCKSGFVI